MRESGLFLDALSETCTLQKLKNGVSYNLKSERSVCVAKRRGNKEGSIYKRGNRWCAQVSLNGKRLTKYFDTQRECREWIRETQAQIDDVVKARQVGKLELVQFKILFRLVNEVRALKSEPALTEQQFFDFAKSLL